MTRVAIKIALALAVVWAAVVAGMRAVGEGAGGEEIAFVAYTPYRLGETRSEIFRMDLRHRLSVNLTHSDQAEIQPQWSPDGSQIAFIALDDQRWGLFVMNADGSSRRKLTDYASDVSNPTWSPDGTHIAYLLEVEDGQRVQVLNLETRRIWEMPYLYAIFTGVRWAADSRRIAYTWRVSQIIVADIASDETQRLDGILPAFSPDLAADRIAYVARGAGIEFQTLPEHTTTRIIQGWESIEEPSWSPDGARVAFVAGMRGSERNLYVADADGSNLRAVPASGWRLNPRWISDHELVFFLGDLNDGLALYGYDVRDESIQWLASISFFTDRYWSYSVRP